MATEATRVERCFWMCDECHALLPSVSELRAHTAAHDTSTAGQVQLAVTWYAVKAQVYRELVARRGAEQENIAGTPEDAQPAQPADVSLDMAVEEEVLVKPAVPAKLMSARQNLTLPRQTVRIARKVQGRRLVSTSDVLITPAVYSAPPRQEVQDPDYTPAEDDSDDDFELDELPSEVITTQNIKMEPQDAAALKVEESAVEDDDEEEDGGPREKLMPGLKVLPQNTNQDDIRIDIFCQPCDVDFATFRALRQHYAESEEKKCTFSCRDCVRKRGGHLPVYPHLPSVTAHVTTIHQPKFQCEICDRKLGARKIALTHMLTHENVTCSVCDVKFDCKDTADDHKKEEHAALIMQCARCDRYYLSDTELVDHIRYYHEDSVPGVKQQCSICHRMFTPGGLEKHMETHQSFACPHCGQQFMSSVKYRRHMKHEHNDELIALCSHCDQRFARPGQLLDHKMEAHKGQLPTMACKKCPLEIPVEHYWLHQSRHRPSVPQKPYTKRTQCEVCLKEVRNLNKHMVIHLEFRNHECTVCDAAFKHKQSLVAHMSKHKETRDHLCGICGRGFKDRVTLRAHGMTHSKERPHACDLCGKAFKTRQNMQYHRSRHAPKTRWGCQLCPRTFASKNGLLRHEGKKHGAADLLQHCKVVPVSVRR